MEYNEINGLKKAIFKKISEELGHGVLPINLISDDGIKIGSWVTVQRQYHKKGILPKEKVDILSNDKYWVWEVGTGGGKSLELKWTEMFDELELFIDKNNHIDVPPNYVTRSGEN